MPIDQFGFPNRLMDTGLISYGDGRELNIDLDAFREMLLQNKRYHTPVQVNEGEFLPPGWVNPAMIGNQERDIDQLGLASFDLWRDLDANIWNASQQGLSRKGLMGQYDANTHDIFLNVDANRADYDYAYPSEDWGKYSVVSHETVHPWTLQSTWDDINEINPLLNLDWYDKPDEAIWSDPTKNPHLDPTLIQPYRSAYDRMHDYLAWNAANYSGFSGYPVGATTNFEYGPFKEHRNWQPTALDVKRMSELNDLARSWNEGTWKPVNTRKESFIRGDEPRRVGNMPRVDEPRPVISRSSSYGNPHYTPSQYITRRGNSTGGIVSLML